MGLKKVRRKEDARQSVASVREPLTWRGGEGESAHVRSAAECLWSQHALAVSLLSDLDVR